MLLGRGDRLSVIGYPVEAVRPRVTPLYESDISMWNRCSSVSRLGKRLVLDLKSSIWGQVRRCGTDQRRLVGGNCVAPAAGKKEG